MSLKNKMKSTFFPALNAVIFVLKSRLCFSDEEKLKSALQRCQKLFAQDVWQKSMINGVFDIAELRAI